MLILEHEGCSKNSSGGPTWVGTISIEHILPRKLTNPSADWTVLPQPGWTNQLQATWLHRLGNLAMLNDSDNSSLGNVSFKRKIAKIDKFNHAPSWTISDLLTHHREGVWNMKAVEQRHERLLALLCSRWNVDDIKTKLSNKGSQLAHCTTAYLHVSYTLQCALLITTMRC